MGIIKRLKVLIDYLRDFLTFSLRDSKSSIPGANSSPIMNAGVPPIPRSEASLRFSSIIFCIFSASFSRVFFNLSSLIPTSLAIFIASSFDETLPTLFYHETFCSF